MVLRAGAEQQQHCIGEHAGSSHVKLRTLQSTQVPQPQAASRALGLFARQRGATTGRGYYAASRCCPPSRRRHTVRRRCRRYLLARRLLSQVRQLGHQFQLQCPVVALIHIRIPNMPKEI